MKKYILYTLILGIGIIMASCSKDKLNPLPKTAIADVNAFDNKDRIISQVNGLYAGVKSGNYRGGRFLVYNDIRPENFLNATSNGVTGYLLWNHTETADENNITSLWNACYAAIGRVNLFLEGLAASNPVSKGILTTLEYKQLQGEALALRGLIYHDLVVMYGKPYNLGAGATPGVPIRLMSYKDNTGNNMARSTVAEVYTQVLKDLDSAEVKLPLTYSTDLLNTTRIHRNTVIALKTRIYLTMNNYAKVISEAVKIVPQAVAPFSATTGVAHSLSANIVTVFSSPYTAKESIFSMPMTTTNLPGTQNSLASYYDPGPAGTGEYYLDSLAIYGNAGWNAADARKIGFTNTVIVRNTSGVITSKKTYMIKFPVGPTQTDFVPVIRYAEVLLNYAEAEALRTGGGVNALSVGLLNAVRGRSYAAGVYLLTDFANSTALKNAIMLERNIELLGEGFRNTDIMRTVAAIPAKGPVISILPTDVRYVFPIPTSELILNTLCIQNQ
jgi:hypothetical protein